MLLQRVLSASVTVAGERIAEIGPGLLAFVGVFPDDGAEQVKWLVDKTLGLRIFPKPGENDGSMNASVVDIGGELLVVSQFTLAADTSRGRRPGFSTAAPPAIAEQIYDDFVLILKERVAKLSPTDGGIRIATGEFGADMRVDLANDGPVTFLLEK